MAQYVSDWLDIGKLTARERREVLDAFDRLNKRNASSEARIQMARYSRAFYAEQLGIFGVVGVRLFAPMASDIEAMHALAKVEDLRRSRKSTKDKETDDIVTPPAA